MRSQPWDKSNELFSILSSSFAFPQQSRSHSPFARFCIDRPYSSHSTACFNGSHVLIFIFSAHYCCLHSIFSSPVDSLSLLAIGHQMAPHELLTRIHPTFFLALARTALQGAIQHALTSNLHVQYVLHRPRAAFAFTLPRRLTPVLPDDSVSLRVCSHHGRNASWWLLTVDCHRDLFSTLEENVKLLLLSNALKPLPVK